MHVNYDGLSGIRPPLGLIVVGVAEAQQEEPERSGHARSFSSNRAPAADSGSQ